MDTDNDDDDDNDNDDNDNDNNNKFIGWHSRSETGYWFKGQVFQ